MSLASLIVVGIGLAFLLLKPSTEPGSGGDSPFTDLTVAQIEEVVRAAAILENNEFDRAIEVYSGLCTKFPKSGACARNLAIARLEKAKLLVSYLSKLPKDLEALGFKDKQAVRDLLPNAFQEAQAAAANGIALQPKEDAVYVIATEIERLRIAQLPSVVAEDERLQLIEKLRGFIKAVPGNPTLADAFCDECEGVSAFHPEFKKDSIQPLLEAFKNEPRNLYLFHKITQGMLELKDPQVAQVIEGFLPSLKRFESEFLREWKSDPTPMIKSELGLIRNDRWEEVSDLHGWLATFKALSAFIPDSKRVSNNSSLALIDLRDVENSIRKAKSDRPNTSRSKIFKEKMAANAQNANCAKWFDWNVDLVPEIVYVANQSLSIAKPEFGSSFSLQAVATTAHPEDVSGIMLIDLYETQGAGQPKINPAEQKAQAQLQFPEMDEVKMGLLLQARHDVYRDVVTFGKDGIFFFAVSNDPPKLERVVAPSGLEQLRVVTGVVPCDWDGDGDLDLMIVAEGKPRWMLNLGNRTFQEISQFSTIPADLGPILSIEACDYDRDVDPDFVFTTPTQIAVFENQLHGEFVYRELKDRWRSLAGAKGLCVAELDGNVSWDWIGTQDKGTEIVLTTTPQMGSVAPLMIQNDAQGGSSVQAADINNDGWQDIVIASANGARAILGGGSAAASSETVPIFESGLVQSLSIADCNQDGSLDCLAIVDGKLELKLGEPARPGMNADRTTIRLKGRNDSNGGGRVNRYAIGSTLELFSNGHYQAQIVRDDVTHFGLGSYGASYNVRIVFTNGLTQNIIDPKVNEVVEEIQAPKGSCPFLYGWDGEKWTFVTDLLWNAPLGLQIAKGKTLPDRRWEHLLVPGKFVQPKDGFYELRITEELWEAAYFDHVQLTAIDHPKDTIVLTNEKVGPASIAIPRLWTHHEISPLRAATDSKGRDWLDALKQADGLHAVPFDRHRCQGLVEPHYVELDFGDVSSQESLQLALTGWIFPTDTSLNIGIDQNPGVDPPSPPSLWLPNAQGEFYCYREFIGFPGGKTKTIVVDLSDLPLEQRKSLRMRIATTNEIYWDQAYLFSDAGEGLTRSVPLSIQSAELGYRGFSEIVIRKREMPHWFDYQQTKIEPQWLPMDGTFTDYGDVKDLLELDDDQMVVLGAGDEMRIQFAIPHQPIPEGWVRDFVLHSTGWDKDADLNTLEGQSSLPLPFAAQKSYPAKSEQLAEAERVWELNRSHMNRTQRMRSFWKRGSIEGSK